jgi:uncharacterized membrane protein YkvA (DUF1232 family)
MTRTNLLGRLLRFRNDLVLLWRGFLHPDTPLYLKALMVGVVAYLLSPLDLVPDILPFLGIVDDLALVAIAVGWIAARLPESVLNPSRAQTRQSPRYYSRGDTTRPVKTIDGTARRL